MNVPILQTDNTNTVTTSLGYGIVLSEHAAATGIVKALLREHTHMLAFRSVGTVLPAELVDIVAESLYELMKPSARELSRHRGISANECLVLSGHPHPKTSPAWEALLDRMDTLGIRLSCLDLSKELVRVIAEPAVLIWQTNKTREPPDTTAAAKYSARRYYEHIDGIMATLEPPSGRAGVPGLTEQTLHWQTSRLVTRRQGLAETMKSLSVCGDVEEAIRTWDAAAAGRFAELLELDVPLQPKVVLYQELSPARPPAQWLRDV